MVFGDAKLGRRGRLRVSVKAALGGILETALARAKTTPLRPPLYETGPQAGA